MSKSLRKREIERNLVAVSLYRGLTLALGGQRVWRKAVEQARPLPVGLLAQVTLSQRVVFDVKELVASWARGRIVP